MAHEDAIKLMRKYLDEHISNGTACYACYRKINKHKRSLCDKCERIFKADPLHKDDLLLNLNTAGWSRLLASVQATHKRIKNKKL